MFDLLCGLCGVIAGVSLVYLAILTAHPRRSTGSWRSWLAAAVVLMLLIPLTLEFVKMELFDEPSLREAIGTLLVPWVAGVGFGILIYLTTIPLRRLLRKLGLSMGRPTRRERRAGRSQYSREVHYKIANSRRYLPKTEERLPNQNAVHPNNGGLVKPSDPTATASVEVRRSSAADPGFNYARPYGTLLAAMLLRAADELDSAVRDIDQPNSTGEGLSADALTMRFKRAMLATLQVSNTVAYFLSQNIELADKKNLIRQLEGREDGLAEKVNAARAAASKVDGGPINATT